MKPNCSQQDRKGSFIRLLTLLLLLSASSIFFAASFRAAPAKSLPDTDSIPMALPEPPALPAPAIGVAAAPSPACVPVITQSTSQDITTTSDACSRPAPTQMPPPPTPPAGTYDNHYWRAFNMGAFTGGAQYDVSSVSFGVQVEFTSQSVTVRLYTNNGEPFPAGTRTQIAAGTVNVTPEQSGTVVTMPLVATVPAGTTELVMELFTPDSFSPFVYAGANSAHETGSSYWSCGNSTPQVINRHIVFNIYGTCSGPIPTPTPTPTPPLPALGNYPDTTILLSADTTVIPVVAPTNTTSITVSTSTNFNGKLEGYPATGVIRVTDAHPAGTYPVTIRAFNSAGATVTRMFTLTVTTPPSCVILNFIQSTINPGQFPSSVVIGDFNGDGRQDLAVAVGPGISIMFGDGTGNFTSSTSFDAGSRPQSLVAGDFNGDGRQDLALSNDSGTVSVLAGDGAGNFTLTTTLGAGSALRQVTAGEFDGDGKQDLAVANYGSNNVSILFGFGTGHFTTAFDFPADAAPYSVAAGDFNNDGKQDLAVANSSSNNVSILLGDGTGQFGPPTNFTAGNAPQSIAVGDFNGDGKQDLAVANYVSMFASILLGDGAGNLLTLSTSTLAPILSWSR